MRTLPIKICILLFYLPCFAQEYNYIRYDTKDGLAGSVVYDMKQDHDGFLWFATETGVSRFDGTNFKNYTVADGLPDNDIIGIFVDSRNRVWMQPFSNSICYYRNGSIFTKHNDSVLSRLNINSYVKVIIENKQGEIVLLQDTKISIIKPDGTIRTYDGLRGKKFDAAAAAGLNKSNNFVFGMTHGNHLKIIERRNDSLYVLDSSVTNKTRRFPIHFSKDLEIFYNEKGFRIDVKAASVSFALPLEGYLKSERLNDSIIVNAWTGFIEFYNIYRHKTERTINAVRNVNDFLEDTEGNWWFSSLGSGVYRLPSREIKNYIFKTGNEIFPVWALEKQADTLYAGTDNYLVWTVNLNNHEKWSRTAGIGRTPGKIVSVNKMPDGSLFAGTETGISEILTRKKNVLEFQSAVKSTHVYGDTLLVGTNWGTYEVDCISMRVIDTMLTARNTAVWKQGTDFYIGKLDGLYILDKEENQRHLGTLHPALTGKISVIRGAPDSTIWVGTFGYGIIGLKNEKVVAIINSDSGLTSNTCRSIFIKDNVLWVGTDKGLNKVQFDGKITSIKKYTVSDGLPSDIINAILYDDKTIYVGTPVGVTFFDEEKVFTNSMCRLKITAIQSPKKQWLHDTSGLQFGHYENNIRIEFVGVSFKSGGDVLYRYKLNGLDDTWRETRDNFLNFLSLPSGDYELELSAVNKFGVQSETLHLHFSVAKLIWEKNWFRVLVILLLATSIWFFVRYRIRKIRQETARNADNARKIAELEQMALKAQMNPHFIFNSLHSIQQYVIDKDVEGANKYISDFARLIRLTLDISSQAKISLADEINYISTYIELEKAKFEGKFDYDVQVSDDIDADSIFVPAMLLQPYIENSIRHGIYYRTDKKGLITIRFSIQNEYLVCMLEDNGVGRKASEQFNSSRKNNHQSKGMLLTSRRIEMLNEHYMAPIFASIEDVYDAEDAKKISGTRVFLRFPIQEVMKQA